MDLGAMSISEKEEYVKRLKEEHKKRINEEKQKKRGEDYVSPQLAYYNRVKQDAEKYENMLRMNNLNRKKRYYENEEMRKNISLKAKQRYYEDEELRQKLIQRSRERYQRLKAERAQQAQQ